MPMEDKKKEPMIDVGEEEGAEVTLDNNEQTKAVTEEKIEVLKGGSSRKKSNRKSTHTYIQATKNDEETIDIFISLLENSDF